MNFVDQTQSRIQPKYIQYVPLCKLLICVAQTLFSSKSMKLKILCILNSMWVLQ